MNASLIPQQPFTPNPLLRNNHLQSIISATSLRKKMLCRRARQLLASSEDIILDCGHGIRLLGQYNAAAAESRGLVTLIHGWEGSSESNYMLSVANSLYQNGFGVVRLNLRDHGPSHHLNRGMFNSTRLDEVLGAMEAIQARWPERHNYLIGFSLGGNFALRVGADRHGRIFELDHIIAVCPLIHPPRSMQSIETGPRLYQRHFVSKWKRSLSKKFELFPEDDFRHKLADMKTLREMHHYFVPNHTDFTDSDSYLQAYSLEGDRLKNLRIPTQLITSADDPLVLAEDLALMNPPPAMTIEVTRYGGHCAFMTNLRLESWLDQRILEILSPYGYY